MTEAFLVIDGHPGTPPQYDDAGLPHAPAYYAAFPQEPSPFGVLTFAPAKTTVMRANYSLFVALPELAKAGSGGAAVLVCHAYQDGLLLPVAPQGASVFAVTKTMDTIDSLIEDEATHDRIRAMPQTTDAERKAVTDAWTNFINGLPGGHIDGQFTEAEAEKLYQQWFGQQAISLEFRSAADLRELLKRVKALRTAKLDRIELRACNIGGNSTTMDRVRKFFGCNRLTAPTVGTFFAVVAVGPLVVGGRAGGAHIPTLQAGPLRHDDFGDAAVSTALTLRTETTRGFLPFSGARVTLGGETDHQRSPSPLFPHTIEPYHGFRFVLRIEETTAFHYHTAAWAAGSATAPPPDPDIIRQFCALAFKADTSFHATALPHAGLWTPDKPNQPFVLPLEREYLPLIAQSPAAARKKP